MTAPELNNELDVPVELVDVHCTSSSSDQRYQRQIIGPIRNTDKSDHLEIYI